MRSRWQDQDGGVAFAVPAMTRVVKALLIANVALFLLQYLILEGTFPRTQAALDEWLALSPARWRADFPWLPLWQLLTYGFLHGGVGHILGNMLFLYFLGTMLEEEIGPRRFAVFYLAALALAGLAQLLLGLALGQASPIVGASGGVLAVVCAVATLRPGTRVIFIIVPMTLRTLALLYVALDLFNVIQELKGAASGVASFAHLAGAALGYAAVRRRWIWRDPLAELESWRERRSEDRQVSDHERLDALLDKISREGIHALSSRERAFLQRMSQRL